MPGIDDYIALWREVLERTRRTRPLTNMRTLAILEQVQDTGILIQEADLDTGSYPAAAKWADPPTWDIATNTNWDAGSTWG